MNSRRSLRIRESEKEYPHVATVTVDRVGSSLLDCQILLGTGSQRGQRGIEGGPNPDGEKNYKRVRRNQTEKEGGGKIDRPQGSQRGRSPSFTEEAAAADTTETAYGSATQEKLCEQENGRSRREIDTLSGQLTGE